MDPVAAAGAAKKIATKVKADSDAVNRAYEDTYNDGNEVPVGLNRLSGRWERIRQASSVGPTLPLMKAVGKPAKWVKERCRCGNKMKYACVVQCEPCWIKVVEEVEERRVQAKLNKVNEEAAWTPAAGSAAASAAANSAPTLGPAPIQRKMCPCGRLINNVRFDKCFNCNAKDKQLKAAADADSDKLLESLKREVADKQRELAKLQLKEANEAFERTQAAVDAGSYGEDSQSD